MVWGTVTGAGQRSLVSELRDRIEKVHDATGYPHPRGGPHVLTERDCGKLEARKDGPWRAGTGLMWVRVQIRFPIAGSRKELDAVKAAIGAALDAGVKAQGGEWRDPLVWRLERECKRQMPRRVRGVRAAKEREAAKR